MGEGLFFHPTLRENLAAVAGEQNRMCERRLCELAATAREAADFTLDLISDGLCIRDVLSAMTPPPLPEPVVHTEAAPENISALTFCAGVLGACDAALFCELYRQALSQGGLSLCEADFLPAAPTHRTVAYVRSALADEAFDVFCTEGESQEDALRVRYVPTLAEAVHAVASDAVGYCILPLEERGVRLSSVGAMLFAHDLHIVSVTPVYGAGADADMKYALVARTCRIPPLRAEDDRYLEIRLPRGTLTGARDMYLACALSYFGIVRYRTNTVFLNTQDGRIPHDILVLRAEGKPFSSLLTFLALFVPEATVVGIYHNLDV